MKSKNELKLGVGIIVLTILCFVSLNSFAHQGLKSNVSKGDNVIVTIDKTTTESGFIDIKSMLKEHGIEVTFTDIQRNDLEELTGIKIDLEDGKSGMAESKISSNIPISEITFGRKDGLLFITQGKNKNEQLGFFNQPNNFSFGFDNDSLASQNFNSLGIFNLNDFFNSEEDSFFNNKNTFDINKLKEQIEQFFNQNNSVISKEPFTFFNDPNTNKLIIIDGKESDFNTLNKLAIENKLEEIDELKPKTAISIYGDKAKDGAIIITTK